VRLTDASGKNCKGRGCSGIINPFRDQEKSSGAGEKTDESDRAVRAMSYTAAEVARYLNISTSAVNRLVSQEELPEIERDKGELF